MEYSLLGAWIAGSDVGRHRAGPRSSPQGGRGEQLWEPALPEGERVLVTHMAWAGGTIYCEYMVESIRLLGICYRKYLQRCLLTFCKCLVLWFICCIADIGPEL